LNALSLCSSLNVRDQVLHPYRITGKSINTHTHTHTHTYIYISVCVCVCFTGEKQEGRRPLER
jgi:hypothetical protein